MIRPFRLKYPLLYTVMYAVLLGVFGFFYYLYVNDGDTSQAFLRGCFLAALLLISTDVLHGVYINIYKQHILGRLARWYYGFYMCAYFTCAMLLMNWADTDFIAKGAVISGISGLFFGVSMAFLAKEKDVEQLAGLYDLDKPLIDSDLSRWIYVAWPLVYILIICGFIAYPPTSGWDTKYLFFQFILLGFLLPIYRRKSGNGFSYKRILSPRSLGLIILLLGFYDF